MEWVGCLDGMSGMGCDEMGLLECVVRMES